MSEIFKRRPSLSWLDFANRKARGSLYTLLAAMFKTVKSNAGQANMAAVLVAQSPTWAQWHVVAVVPPQPLIPESGRSGIIKEDD